MDKGERIAMWILIMFAVGVALFYVYKKLMRPTLGTNADGRVPQGAVYNPNALPSSQVGMGGGTANGAGAQGGVGDYGQLAAGIGSGVGSLLGGIGQLVKGLDGSTAGSGGNAGVISGDYGDGGDEGSTDSYYN